VWRVALPGRPFPAAIHTELGAPLIHGDHIYVGQAGTDGLHILARDSGALVRTLPAGAPVQAAPVVVDDLLVSTDLSGTTTVWEFGEGFTLKKRWERSAGAPVLSAVAISRGLVMVAGVDNVVTAVDLKTGELVWRHAQRLDPGRSAELELYGAPTPVVHQDLVISGFSDGTVTALAHDTGDVVWQRRVGEGQYPDILGSPSIVGEDIVVAGYSEPLVGMHADSRNVRWRLDVGGAGAPLPGGGDGARPNGTLGGDQTHAFIYHGGEDGILRCVDARTGALVWEWDSETASALTEPVATEAGVLVGAAAGSVYLIDAATGNRSWEWEPGFHISGVTVPVAVGGRQAVAVTNAGNIVSFVVPAEAPPWGQDDGIFSRIGGRNSPDRN
jgi:outer membrane protein assembly factor BamB